MGTKEEPFDLLHPQPLLVVISGPSGVGKDSVIKGLKARDLKLHFVVTATSRAARPDEVDGKDYFFYSREEFAKRIENGEFIEHAMVYGDYKGIPCCEIEDAINCGQDVILKVDVQGAATIRRLYPHALLIFLIPRNYEEWYNRLAQRNTEDKENFKLRVETSLREVSQVNLFDYVVINSENRLEDAVDDIISIIRAEHLAVNPRVIS